MDTDPEAEPLRLPTVLGVPTVEKAEGRLWFQLAGQQVQLQALDGGDGELFVIFADVTNGDTTYGAGRFLWVKGVDASGHTTIDFNRAYNPPCAFTPFGTCPLPPPGNRLDMAVLAGERKWRGGDH